MSEVAPLVSLYRNAQMRQGDDFPAFALGWLSTQLHFDAGAIVTSMPGQSTCSAAHFYGYEEPAAVCSTWGPGSPFNQLNLRLSAKPLTADCQDIAPSEIEPGECRPFRQSAVPTDTFYSAGIAVPTDAGRSMTFVMLTRQRKSRQFTRHSMKQLERLAPHVAEAMAVSRSMALLRSPNLGISSMPVALVDGEGRFVQATHAFNQLFWNDSVPQVTHLKPECMAAIRRGQAWPLSTAGAAHCLYGVAENGGWYLVIRPLSHIDRLSERERGLAQLFARGVTRKDIAKQLGLSPSTVKNHLSNVYRKLVIKDRVGLIRTVQDGAGPSTPTGAFEEPSHLPGSRSLPSSPQQTLLRGARSKK